MSSKPRKEYFMQPAEAGFSWPIIGGAAQLSSCTYLSQ
jgi:hypothetical protein